MGLVAPATRTGGPKKGSQSRDLFLSLVEPGVVSDASTSESGSAGVGLPRDFAVKTRIQQRGDVTM